MTSPMWLLGTIQASSHLLVASSTIAHIGNPIQYDHHQTIAHVCQYGALETIGCVCHRGHSDWRLQDHDIWNKFPAKSIVSSRKVDWTDKQLLCQMYFLIEHDLVLYCLDTMPFGRISILSGKNELFLDGMRKATRGGTTFHQCKFPTLLFNRACTVQISDIFTMTD